MNRKADIAYQKSLGPFLRFYYGVNLYKCCDVFQKLEHTKDFKALCYWKCPVCGRETAKYQMPWLASKEWQEMTKPFEQISIEEWLLTAAGKGWKLIPVGSVVAFDTKGKTIPLVQSVNENKVMNEPDLVLEGAVNGTPAYIGFKEWVSGWDSCFTEYEAIQYKLKEE